MDRVMTACFWTCFEFEDCPCKLRMYHCYLRLKNSWGLVLVVFLWLMMRLMEFDWWARHMRNFFCPMLMANWKPHCVYCHIEIDSASVVSLSYPFSLYQYRVLSKKGNLWLFIVKDHHFIQIDPLHVFAVGLVLSSLKIYDLNPTNSTMQELV